MEAVKVKIGVDKVLGYTTVTIKRNRAIAPWGYHVGPNVINLFAIKRPDKLKYNK